MNWLFENQLVFGSDRSLKDLIGRDTKELRNY